MEPMLRILHLEDDPIDRELVETTLAAEGFAFEVKRVETREEYLEALESGTFDLILADFKLPSFDGLTALEIAKKRCPLAPFIIVSGTLGEEPAIETLKSGATDYVLKDKMARLGPAVKRAMREVAEREVLDRLEKERRNTLRRLDLQARYMPLANIFLDKDFRVIGWNPAAESIFGWNHEEAIGKSLYGLVFPPGSGYGVEELRRNVLKDTEVIQVQCKNVGKAGKVTTCDWFVTTLREKGGAEVEFLAMAHDVSEKHILEKQLQAAQRMESLGTLAGGVAHDFNNMLTGILGFTEILRSRLAGVPAVLEDLDEIRQSAEKASMLTKQLLALSRRQAVELTNIDLNSVVSDMGKLLRKVIGEQVEISVRLSENLPVVRADRGQIEQILMNLCINSRDAMPGGGRLMIETGEAIWGDECRNRHPYASPGRYSMVAVSDTGTGMDEKVRERVFEPFFTTKAPDKGTGLGLSVVYGIVKQHNGFINLYSEPGKGTTFKVYFQAVDASPDSMPAVSRDPVRGGTETILVAEDEVSIRALIERVLSEYGYKVLTACDGEEAVETYRRHEGIALSILDMVMPKKGGTEAFRAMTGKNPGMKVIFMSGYSPEAVRESFSLEPKAPFLPKPFGPLALLRKVREVLDG